MAAWWGTAVVTHTHACKHTNVRIHTHLDTGILLAPLQPGPAQLLFSLLRQWDGQSLRDAGI